MSNVLSHTTSDPIVSAPTAEIEALHQEGKNLLNHNCLEDAQEAFKKILVLSPNAEMRAKATINLGIIAMKQGHMDKAEEYYQCALEEKVSTDTMAIGYFNFGLLLRMREQHASAEGEFKKALELTQRTPLRASVLIQLGIVQMLQDQYDSGRDSLKESLRIYSSLNDISGIFQARLGLGEIELTSRNYDRAEVEFRLLLQGALQHNNDRTLGITFKSLARVEAARKKTSEAKELASRAITYFQNAHSEDDVKQMKDFISTISEGLEYVFVQ